MYLHAENEVARLKHSKLRTRIKINMKIALNVKGQGQMSPAFKRSAFTTVHIPTRNTESDTERRMLRSCRNTAKHPDTVRDTWDRIATLLSMRTPRSRTVVEGSTLFSPTRTAADGRWFCRRVVEHQRISVFAVFSCRRFASIQSDSSSRKADRVDWSWLADPGRRQPCICVSSAYRWGLRPYPQRDRSSQQCIRWTAGGPTAVIQK